MKNEQKNEVMNNSCHAKLDLASSTHAVMKQQALKILNQVQDDNVKRTTHGFTLIELLVVVLIIGILTAVAVPQYQKAVWKTRSLLLQRQVMDLVQAQKRYFLANGTYAKNFDEFDIDFNLPYSKKDSSQSIKYDDNIELKLFYGTYLVPREKIIVEGSFRSGPYATAGFRYVFDNADDTHYQNHTLHCIEPFLSGKFCTQIVGASYKFNASDGMIVLPM